MKKKILVAAIGAALSVSVAAAQAAEVKVSGYGHVSLDMIKGNTGDGLDNNNNMNVSSNASNVVISASEDLGNGMKGIFSLQQFYRMDNTNTSANRDTGGNTYVGLSSGAAGTFILGAHDTPAKLAGRSADLFGNQIGDTRNLDVAGTRANNVAAYMSPNWGGFSFALAHSTNLDPGVQKDATDAAVSTESANAVLVKYAMPNIISVAVGIDMTQMDLAKTAAPATVDAFDDEEWMTVGVSAGPFGGVKINATYQQHDNAGGNKLDDRTTMGAGVAVKFGNETIKAQYTMYEDDDLDDLTTPLVNESKTDASMLSVGYDHSFSKAFTGYVAYAMVDNDEFSNKSMAGGGHGDNPGSVTGKDMNGFSLGMVFKF